MSQTILKINNLSKVFKSKKINVNAVSDVSFEVKTGETIGIVGESGCGKTTLGRCIVKAIAPTKGEILYTAANGKEYDIANISKEDMKKIRKEIQLIFQDPYASLDPRMTVFDIISEPLKANFKDMPKSEIEEIVKTMAEKVGSNPTYLRRYPHAFSGGQRQRIGIARALVLKPRLIVCDEAVSALDVSVQAQVINLLKDLQKDMGLTYLFISHDLSVIEHISTKVGVMYLGKMVEFATSKELFRKPFHPYSEALISAIPIADTNIKMERIPLEGEIPNPANAPSGCYFHTRCRYCEEKCKTQIPVLVEKEEEHFHGCIRDLTLQGIPSLVKKEEGI